MWRASAQTPPLHDGSLLMATASFCAITQRCSVASSTTKAGTATRLRPGACGSGSSARTGTVLGSFFHWAPSLVLGPFFRGVELDDQYFALSVAEGASPELHVAALRSSGQRSAHGGR